MSKKRKNTKANFWFWLYVVVLLVIFSIYQGKIEYQRKLQIDLQRQLEILKSRYIEISTQLQYLQLEGNIEKEIHKRNLNLVKDKIPYVIEVEPEKDKEQ